MSVAPWPIELKVDATRTLLTIAFDNGENLCLPAEYLRVESPSAEVKGHGTRRPPPVAGKRHVRIAGAEPVGNYAVRIIFDDGHDTGLYSWDYLRELGHEQAAKWNAYLAALARAGLERE